MPIDKLFEQARAIAALLIAKNQTVAVAESSSGGLISAALLAVPGASAYYLGGGVIYTPRARHRLLDLTREDMRGLQSASEPYAALLADTVRERFSASWGISETGAAGPTGNPYGDAAGHCCFAVVAPLRSGSRRVLLPQWHVLDGFILVIFMLGWPHRVGCGRVSKVSFLRI